MHLNVEDQEAENLIQLTLSHNESSVSSLSNDKPRMKFDNDLPSPKQPDLSDPSPITQDATTGETSTACAPRKKKEGTGPGQNVQRSLRWRGQDVRGPASQCSSSQDIGEQSGDVHKECGTRSRGGRQRGQARYNSAVEQV